MKRPPVRKDFFLAGRLPWALACIVVFYLKCPLHSSIIVFPRPLLHSSFLPPCLSQPWPSYCNRPRYRVQVFQWKDFFFRLSFFVSGPILKSCTNNFKTFLNLLSWERHTTLLLGASTFPSLATWPPLRYKKDATDYLESGQIPGNGGDYLGLNTGVVLFNLTR